METISLDTTGIILMLMLGLRHGLDPDHIAIIDGMTMKHSNEHSPYAKWVGTFFAIGHGLVVTIIAVLVNLLRSQIHFPDWLVLFAEWIPVGLLLLVGSLNLRSLLSSESHAIVGWRSRIIPSSLMNSSHPLAVIIIGVLFATVFDTATQAAAWGYAASQQGGLPAAILMGLIFSAGMIATDTIDGRILYNILNKTNSKTLILRYRRWIGWTIVCMSFAVAGYKIVSMIIPSMTLSETASSIIGLVFILFVAGIYVVTIIRNSKIRVS
jgi:high-affinity nickel-transport protein